MSIELKVPPVGESITEVEIGAWLKKPGDRVEKDDPIVEIESDKATVEVSAPVAGTLTQILKPTGTPASIGEVVGFMEAGVTAAVAPKSAATAPAPKPASASTPVPALTVAAISTATPKETSPLPPPFVMPSAERVIAEKNLRVEDVIPSGPGGRVLKEDALKATPAEARPASAPITTPAPAAEKAAGPREEEVVRMTPLRRAASEALLHAQTTMALLTTFNECDMSAVMAMRNHYKQQYEEKRSEERRVGKECRL